MPSLTIIGENDALAPTTLQLAGLYEEAGRRVYYHSSDHRPFPPVAADAAKLAATIRDFMLEHAADHNGPV